MPKAPPMDLSLPGIHHYAEQYSSPEDALLQEINAYTVTHHREANMLSGHLQGKVLEMLSSMIRPRRVLEIGTFTGYSALCMAKGLADDGELHTLELRQEDADLARGFFDRSPLGKKIVSHVGDAAGIIP